MSVHDCEVLLEAVPSLAGTWRLRKQAGPVIFAHIARGADAARPSCAAALRHVASNVTGGRAAGDALRCLDAANYTRWAILTPACRLTFCLTSSPGFTFIFDVQPLVDLLHPSAKDEKRKHKKKRLVQVRHTFATHPLVNYQLRAWRPLSPHRFLHCSRVSRTSCPACICRAPTASSWMCVARAA